MTINELGSILREMYGTAKDGDLVVMIHLFGVKYSEQIETCGGTAKDIAKAAGISDTYGTEIRKGVRLAQYVNVKPSA